MREHLIRYPASELADLYKLLQQATLGNAHAVDPRTARRWMDEEIGRLALPPESGTTPDEPLDEPLVERLGRTGRLARVHLRPFLARGGRPERLVEAFVQSAEAAPPDTSAFACALSTLRAMGDGGRLPWPGADVKRFLDLWEAEGYPTGHHSAAYELAYRPAYRVVAVDLLPLAMRGVRDRSGGIRARRARPDRATPPPGRVP